ncbi:CDP-archaeol synthase [Gammaproteobacteria bacterium]
MAEIVVLILFLVWANFAPFLVGLWLGERWGTPVDFGRKWWDGLPVFGSHKTWRGIATSIVGSALAAPLMIDVSWWAGAVAGGLAMVGDLVTSFLKRRLHDPEGEDVPAVDQVLEGILPASFTGWQMGLSPVSVVFAVLLFVPLGEIGARFWRHILRTHPLVSHDLRSSRVITRVREWRACYMPLADWHKWLNLESYVYYRVILARFFRLIGCYKCGLSNALAPKLREITIESPAIPVSFDGFRVLFLTDLHLDGAKGLTEVVIEQIRGLEVDLCLVGGDIRMELYGSMAPSLRLLRLLIAQIRAKEGVLGVLGNHDCIDMLREFEEAGVRMLVNDNRCVTRGGENLWVVGVDDPHHYRGHNLDQAFRGVGDGFRLFLAHSPEVYEEAAAQGTHLYLCGHTHGGQICLPGIGPIVTHCRAPRAMAAGRWNYQQMIGYTSAGVGASGIPLRFYCPGEITLITLRRSVTIRTP